MDISTCEREIIQNELSSRQVIKCIKTKTCMRGVMKPKQQKVVRKASQFSLLQELRSVDKNLTELVQPPPIQDRIKTTTSFVHDII